MSSKFRKNYTMLLFVSFSEGGLCLAEPQAFGGGGDIHKSGAGQDQDPWGPGVSVTIGLLPRGWRGGCPGCENGP